MKQQEGRSGGRVKQSHHFSQDCWCQCTQAAAKGRGWDSLCLCRGQWASCEASCGQQTEGWAPLPSTSLFLSWPCPRAPSPTVPRVLASWRPRLPKGPRSGSSMEFMDPA